MLKDLKTMIKLLGEIRDILKGKDDEMSDLEKQYKEYKYLADSRGMKLLGEQGLLDEYNEFMCECEKVLFAQDDDRAMTYNIKVVLPKPSPALEKFKNRFNKFF